MKIFLHDQEHLPRAFIKGVLTRPRLALQDYANSGLPKHSYDHLLMKACSMCAMHCSSTTKPYLWARLLRCIAWRWISCPSSLLSQSHVYPMKPSRPTCVLCLPKGVIVVLWYHHGLHWPTLFKSMWHSVWHSKMTSGWDAHAKMDVVRLQERMELQTSPWEGTYG